MNYGSSRSDPVAALPTGQSMNPCNPKSAPFYSKGQTAYVLFKRSESRRRPTRVFTSFGNFPEWKLGTVIHLGHDQTNMYLGEYEIVGIHHFDSGEMAGDVPDMKIRHCVAK